MATKETRADAKDRTKRTALQNFLGLVAGLVLIGAATAVLDVAQFGEVVDWRVLGAAVLTAVGGTVASYFHRRINGDAKDMF